MFKSIKNGMYKMAEKYAQHIKTTKVDKMNPYQKKRYFRKILKRVNTIKLISKGLGIFFFGLVFSFVIGIQNPEYALIFSFISLVLSYIMLSLSEALEV